MHSENTELDPRIDPRTHQPNLVLPDGLNLQTVKTSLASASLDGASSVEFATYVDEDLERFIQTLELVPHGPQSLLEIGANPYFMSVLLKRHRMEAQLSATNYFGVSDGGGVSKIDLDRYDGAGKDSFEFNYQSVNVEVDAFPFPDAGFNTILFCEVIEHLLTDPLHALIEINRLLDIGGHLVLTTPNVARLENVARMISGANLYDPYSGYGPYGRHNREYTKHELWRLMQHAGFEVEELFTADVHHNRAPNYMDPNLLTELLAPRGTDLGQYIFSRWRKIGPPDIRRPSWLYRSLPVDQLVEVAL